MKSGDGGRSQPAGIANGGGRLPPGPGIQDQPKDSPYNHATQDITNYDQLVWGLNSKRRASSMTVSQDAGPVIGCCCIDLARGLINRADISNLGKYPATV